MSALLFGLISWLLHDDMLSDLLGRYLGIQDDAMFSDLLGWYPGLQDDAMTNDMLDRSGCLYMVEFVIYVFIV